MATQQRGDGSFPTDRTGQPAITSLAILAFASSGHLPGEGKYGVALQRGVEYVLDQARPNGSICLTPSTSDNAAYNHAISGLMLCEIYGMAKPNAAKRISEVIERAVAFTLKDQRRPKRNPRDEGAWRYLPNHPVESHDPQSDLSVTSWQLMFLRSAKNAGFEVDITSVDMARRYVVKLYNERTHTFNYAHEYRAKDFTTRGMTGAGILSLSLGGMHDTEMARSAADWLLEHSFDRYNRGSNDNDVYHYGAYYCSHAMFQVGGEHWQRFFPPLFKTLVANQRPQGNWALERAVPSHARYGENYTTAFAVLALTVPWQLLPVFQR
jgi:hypothetical protein